MLEENHLQEILNQTKLTRQNLLCLEKHIQYIGQIKDQWGEELPEDVCDNLDYDLTRIIEYLTKSLAVDGVFLLEERK